MTYRFRRDGHGDACIEVARLVQQVVDRKYSGKTQNEMLNDKDQQQNLNKPDMELIGNEAEQPVGDNEEQIDLLSDSW